MKLARLITLILICFSPPFFVQANDDSAVQNSFPDFLDDEIEYDDEKLEEDFIEPGIWDPLEPVNRVFFEFNDSLYEWVLKPATDGYIWLLPRDLRESFGNFYLNLSSPVRLLNSVLQGEFKQSGNVLGRFVINSTFGVYGLVDVASLEFGMRPVRADFGQTLGRWGMGEGLYIFWPIFGPSSVRGSLGLIANSYSHPVPYFFESRVLDLAYYTSNRLNTLSLKPDLYEDLKRFSLDPYIASRQVYYEYRKNLIEKR